MNKLHMVLANNVDLPIYDCSVSEPHIVCNYESKADFDTALEKIFAGNLSHIDIMRGNEIVLTFNDCVLDGIQMHFNSQGIITVHYYFRENAHNITNKPVTTIEEETEAEAE